MGKTKYVLYGIFIGFILISLVAIGKAYYNINQEIYIKDIDKYTDAIMRMKNRVEEKKLTDSCKSALDKTIDRVNNTHFKTGKVKQKDYYEAYFKDNETFLDYYQLVIDDCNIDNNDKIYGMALSAYSFPLEIKNNYYLNYELHFKDLTNGQDLRKEEQEVKSFNTKYMELMVLDSLLEVLK